MGGGISRVCKLAAVCRKLWDPFAVRGFSLAAAIYGMDAQEEAASREQEVEADKVAKAIDVVDALAIDIAKKLGFGLQDMQGYRPSM